MNQLAKRANAFNPVGNVLSALSAAAAQAELQKALSSDVFTAIERRMQGIDKNFVLRAHVAGDLVVHLQFTTAGQAHSMCCREVEKDFSFEIKSKGDSLDAA